MSLVSMRNISMVALLASISGVGLARHEEPSEDCRLEAEMDSGGLRLRTTLEQCTQDLFFGGELVRSA